MTAAPNNILLVWADPSERKKIFKILRATGAAVDYITPAELARTGLQHPYRLVVFDYDSVPEPDGILGNLANAEVSAPVLVVSAARDKDDLVRLFSNEGLTNLIAKNTEVRASELVVTVQKILRNDIFGLEKYLTWGVEPVEHLVTSSAAKAEVLESLDEYLREIGCNKRLTELAKSVADEFVMNAVYNAPVDMAGRAKYASRPRSEAVELLPSEHALFRHACDGQVLALSIEDKFGRLERDTVMGYLRKCFLKGDSQIDSKSGGAGLGLYYIFESLNHLIVNVKADDRTEVIGLMDISGSYRDFAERPKSINIFLEETRR